MNMVAQKKMLYSSSSRITVKKISHLYLVDFLCFYSSPLNRPVVWPEIHHQVSPDEMAKHFETTWSYGSFECEGHFSALDLICRFTRFPRSHQWLRTYAPAPDYQCCYTLNSTPPRRACSSVSHLKESMRVKQQQQTAETIEYSDDYQQYDNAKI